MSDLTDPRTGHVVVEGCIACPSRKHCRLLYSSLDRLGTQALSGGGRLSSWQNAVAELFDQIDRHGFNYPVVLDYKRCWLNEKKGALGSYLAEVRRLLKQAPVKAEFWYWRRVID